jgi:hypothetical protein
VLTDAALCWDLLARGGVMIFDDLQRRWRNGKPYVREGVLGFLDAFESRYIFIYRAPRNYAIRKIK